MLVLDWMCIDLCWEIYQCVCVMCFDLVDFVVFDLYILKWFVVVEDYFQFLQVEVVCCFVDMIDDCIVQFGCNVGVGLFGLVDGYFLL